MMKRRPRSIRNLLEEKALSAWISRVRREIRTSNSWIVDQRRYDLAGLAEAIRDPLLYEEALLPELSPDRHPNEALRVARFYLECGRPEVALMKIPDEGTDYDVLEMIDTRLAIHRVLGDLEEVRKLLLKRFSCSRDMADLEGYLDLHPEADRPKLRTKVRDGLLARSGNPIGRAVVLDQFGEREEAVRLVLANPVRPADGFMVPAEWLKQRWGEAEPLACTVLARMFMEGRYFTGGTDSLKWSLQEVPCVLAWESKVVDWENIPRPAPYWQEFLDSLGGGKGKVARRRFVEVLAAAGGVRVG